MFALLTAPGIIPFQALDINQNPHKLRNSQRWVRVIQLDCDLVGEFAPSTLALLKPSHDVVKRSRAPEVLLLQSKLFATLQTAAVRFRVGKIEGIYSLVIWIEDRRDRLSTLLVGN